MVQKCKASLGALLSLGVKLDEPDPWFNKICLRTALVGITVTPVTFSLVILTRPRWGVHA